MKNLIEKYMEAQRRKNPTAFTAQDITLEVLEDFRKFCAGVESSRREQVMYQLTENPLNDNTLQGQLRRVRDWALSQGYTLADDWMVSMSGKTFSK